MKLKVKYDINIHKNKSLTFPPLKKYIIHLYTLITNNIYTASITIHLFCKI